MQRNFLVEDQIQPLGSFDGTSPSAAVRPILREVKLAIVPAPRNIHLSIVSHCHGWMIRELLEDLSHVKSVDRFFITLTENVPETTHYHLDKLPFPVRIIKNSTPKGFSSNHNAAFRSIPLEDQRYFIVLNPDVRLQGEPFLNLVKLLDSDPTLGVVGPAVINPKGTLEDSARPVPSVWSLFREFRG
ncbi:MAG: hypothetical protein HQL49_07680 [Gammaproteobacteria bacterium]|nr:hypothetical protein [Gammaproteobacteria bacterium]